MWPSIPLVVSQATVGTAMGLTTSIQMIGIGISNLIVGQILGKSDKSVIHCHFILSTNVIKINVISPCLIKIKPLSPLNIPMIPQAKSVQILSGVRGLIFVHVYTLIKNIQ